ncbi:hypothetical protein K431DRAFT_199669, partial [Polychaeton citri CBS 116435]
RAERARRAKDTVNKAIPEILRSSPRARHGIHRADLVVDPATTASTPMPSGVMPGLGFKIRLQCADTLSAAARLSERPFATKRTTPSVKSTSNTQNVTILNMASPLKPGGGFLEGANSQEEFICTRTTLYPSLWDSFYRLPEIGGIWTPDVMVFRDHTPEANDLAKKDRYFVDVITSGMLRFPEVKGKTEGGEKPEGCSCGVSYCDRDRELVTRKMKAVMRIAQANGAQKLVLGAWGCGAYGNPVKEVAKIWRKVIVGSPRQRRPNSERWNGIQEIVFAIPDRTMLREFEKAFEDVLAPEISSPHSEQVDTPKEPSIEITDLDESAATTELIAKIAETEMQLEQIRNPRSKARLREILANLNKELAQGLANKASVEQDLTLEADEAIEDYVFPDEDDGESGNVYNFDENDVASDSSTSELTSEGNVSEVYEFRFGSAPSDTKSAAASKRRRDEDDEDGSVVPMYSHSPHFNPQTGWFAGSIDHLSALLRGTK